MHAIPQDLNSGIKTDALLHKKYIQTFNIKPAPPHRYTVHVQKSNTPLLSLL